MRYYYKASYTNYKIAMRAHIQSSLARRIYFHLCMWGMLVIGFSILLISIFSANTERFTQPILLPLAFGLIAGGVATPLVRTLQLQRAYKVWNGELMNNKDIFIEVDGPVLLSGVEGEREGKFQHSAFCNVVENEEIVLLYLNKKKFLFFSKTFLPLTFFDDLHTWLELPGAPPPC